MKERNISGNQDRCEPCVFKVTNLEPFCERLETPIEDIKKCDTGRLVPFPESPREANYLARRMRAQALAEGKSWRIVK